MKIELSSNMKKAYSSKWKDVQKKAHRRRGKSYTRWHSNGQKWHEDYYVNGSPHNTKGPALTRWCSNGQKAYEIYYYLNRECLTKGQWETKCKLN